MAARSTSWPVQEQSAEVIHEHKEVAALAAFGAWVRHKRTPQHVTKPDLVRPFGFETTERSRLTSQRSTIETASAQIRPDGALGNAHAVARFEDRGDLCG